ncbi:YihA family ribosome biogenesis GTP-binding protein [candidate division KSB1 bacterium]|nr:YihA family ribosome biogenesis GTP-binding protein [candidate division KSB1 bacterium]
MKITQAEYIKSVYHIHDLPKDDLPQVAFAGRSNVGKSSLLNALLQRRKLAHVSATPGKTQCLNFYRINNAFYFVDLPGYGYARAAKTLIHAWQGLIETYLQTAANLRLLISLIDLRHDPSPLDRELWGWLMERQQPFVVVGTKADKLSSRQIHTQWQRYKQMQGIVREHPLIPFSVRDGRGKNELWKVIEAVLR